MENFINEPEIFNVLNKNITPDKNRILEVLSKAREKKGLTLDETAVLIQCQDKEIIQEIYKTANEIKNAIYGNRVVFFAPLYVTNACGNDCLYCGFRASNTGLKRKTLTVNEVQEEVKILENMGHKRVLLVYGESQKVDYLVKTIEAVYAVKEGKGEIRRVNINSAPMTVDEFKTIKQTGIGTYQCFQETYHLETYNKMHIAGKKTDYNWRLNALGRAQEGGLDDVSGGVLFGLYDWKFEVLALLQHCFHLESKYGVGPHTLSVPRIEPALNAPVSENPPYSVNDEDFKKIVAILRIAVPYTGLILSTRETAEMRHDLLSLGISQISAGSKTYPGGYKDAISHMPEMEQFTLGDTRPLDEVIYSLLESGFMPSFCTACYRLGRTGQDFMSFAKPGDIHMYCTPNALVTFAEYLQDYSSKKTKELGWKVLEKEMEKVEPQFKKMFTEKMASVKNGSRDVFF